MIKKLLPYVFLAALVSGTIFLWSRVPVPCEEPLQYSLGTFDTRFGLSEADFLKEAAAAEGLWEKALGKELFQYVPGATFKVNLIFDTRQEQTIEGQKLDATFEQTKASQETLEQKQAKTLALYEKTKNDYERMLSSFQKRVSVYNADVEKWNRQGGATQEEYQNLKDTSKALAKEGEVLESKRQTVNNLAAEVNAFSKQKVAVAEQYNERVEDYVNRYGTSGEFDQGDYVGQEINIYQYDDVSHLRAVLTHEFGHALGLVHGSDPRSVMFHLMKDQNLEPVTLTAEDKEMLLAQCNQTVWDIMLGRIDVLQQWLTDHEDKKGILGL